MLQHRCSGLQEFEKKKKQKKNSCNMKKKTVRAKAKVFFSDCFFFLIGYEAWPGFGGGRNISTLSEVISSDVL